MIRKQLVASFTLKKFFSLSKNKYLINRKIMEHPIISVKDGQLMGKLSKDLDGNDFYIFLGIPYAKPPIGNLRFKAPLPVEPWTDVRNAREDGNSCFSRHHLLRTLTGDEDCLYLNVYTPSISSEIGLKPVMVWIHGGGFTSGSSTRELYGPEFLIAEDIVLVTINYRLGVLGFLSFEDPDLGVPGNAGMKDMVMALKWVQNNIEEFRGDPNNVTIFGESAGGSAVHYLMLSPMAKGLFHKVIAQSGCALHLWSRGNVKCAKKISKVLSLEHYTDKELLEHLRTLPVNLLWVAAEKVGDVFKACEQRPWCPIVEKPSDEEAFLLEEPLKLLKSGQYNKVPLMIGYTTREGMLSLVLNSKFKQQLLNNFEFAIPYFLNIKRGSTTSKLVAKKIKDFYFKDEAVLEDIDQYLILETDNFFFREICNSIKYHVKTSPEPVYFYRMSIETELNLYKKLFDIKEKGTSHADDLGYLFKNLLNLDVEKDSLPYKAIKTFTKLWTNFARYGDPTAKLDDLINVKWKAAKLNELNYLDIGDKLTLDINPEAERMAFWDEIFQINSTHYNYKL